MSRKRTAQSASAGIQLGLIITPMLDMAFQILAFFIMTYHPSALEAHIPGSLVPGNPAVKGPDAPIVPAEAPLPTEKELLDGLDDAVTVKLKANANGSARQIFVLQPPAIEPELVADVEFDLAAALDRLSIRLKAMRKHSANLKIAADGELRQQYVMGVYDTAKKAGFDKIHFVPPPALSMKLAR